MISFFGAQLENNFIVNKYNFKINDILKSGISLGGKYTELLEDTLNSVHPGYNTIAVGSATDALFFALKACNSKRVAVPSVSFKATLSAVKRAGAIPIMVDVESDSLMGLESLRNSEEVDTILFVSLYGKSNTPIYKYAKDNNIKIIEDSAQCDFIKNNPDIGVLSFDPTKILSSFGSGGAIICKSEYYSQIKNMRKHGTPFGYNSQIAEISAWLVNLKIKWHLNEWQMIRKQIANDYLDINTIHLYDPSRDTHALSKYVIRVDDPNDFIKYMLSKEIECKRHYSEPLAEMFMSSRLSKEVVSLPIHPFLKKDQINKIVENANAYLDNR